MIISLLTMGLDYLISAIAAHFESYFNFLFVFFIVSCGLVLLQVALNTYVTILGNPAKAGSRLSISAALNAIDVTCAAPITSFFVLKKSININLYIIQAPYLSLLLLLVTLIFKFPKPLDVNFNQIKTFDITGTNKSIWRFRHLWLGGILCTFSVEGCRYSPASSNFSRQVICVLFIPCSVVLLHLRFIFCFVWS